MALRENLTSRMAALLGRLRREMNGAVAESMARGGIQGLLNYGVSIPTILMIVEQEPRDHAFATFLYRQQVRELRIAALKLAEPELLTCEELDFWIQGATTLELRDLLATYLLAQAPQPVVEELLSRLADGDESLCQVTLHTLTRHPRALDAATLRQVVATLERHPESLVVATAVVRLFAFRFTEHPRLSLPPTTSSRYVAEELDALFG